MFHHIKHKQRCGALAIGWMLQHFSPLVAATQWGAIGGFGRCKVFKRMATACGLQACHHIFSNSTGVKTITAFGGYQV